MAYDNLFYSSKTSCVQVAHMPDNPIEISGT